MAAHAVDPSRTDAATPGDSYAIDANERWPTRFERTTTSGSGDTGQERPQVTLADLHALYSATVARIDDDAHASAFVVGHVIGELGGHDVVVTALLGSSSSREGALEQARRADDSTRGPAIVLRSVHRLPDGTPTMRFTVVRADTRGGVRVTLEQALATRTPPRFGDLAVTDIVFGTCRVSPADIGRFNPWLFLLE